jgi:hypothetical protein
MMPRIIGPTRKSYREVGLIENGKLIGSVDLVGIGMDGQIYLIEAKVKNTSKKTTARRVDRLGNRQLRKYGDFIQREFGITPVLKRVSMWQGKRRPDIQTVN